MPEDEDFDECQNPELIEHLYRYLGNKFIPKNHTIRAGGRWKEGDKFSPRVWSGKPYNSPMIKIGPDTEVRKIWKFDIIDGCLFIDDQLYAYSSSTDCINKLAENDGLGHMELLDWFKYPKEFHGQIICWNENINY